MCRREGMHVVDLAIRATPVVVGSAVPTRDSDFCVDRFNIGRKADKVTIFRRLLRFRLSHRGRGNAVRFRLRDGRRRGYVHLRLLTATAADEGERTPDRKS